MHTLGQQKAPLFAAGDAKRGLQSLPGMLPQVVLDGSVNPAIVHEIQTRQSCSITEVRSLADFLLMQLSWIYDLNYSATFHQIINRNIMDAIEQLLPQRTED